ncbi:MAG: hypothetical protein EOP11_09780 [Proteobacteria bacterium]|nr:MAG: hypothetical protein EOP11_09780 [Pseudomonadota bacterium]
MAARALIALTCLTFTSCAAMDQMQRDQSCTSSIGYESGVNDGRAHRPMNSNFASVCDPQTRDEVTDSYRRGYESVRPGNNFDDNGDGFRMRGGGFDIRLPGKPNHKKWVCEVEAFGQTFSGFGASRGEAAQNARDKCEGQNNAMHCSKVECDRAD